MARLTAPQRALGRALAPAGWLVSSVEMDLHRGQLAIELKRSDGLWVYLRSDGQGGASLSRYQDSREFVARAGCYPTEQVRVQFLGRDRIPGLRAGLRRLALYVADNPAPGRQHITSREARNALGIVMRRR